MTKTDSDKAELNIGSPGFQSRKNMKKLDKSMTKLLKKYPPKQK
jgi:hypothetical protein